MQSLGRVFDSQNQPTSYEVVGLGANFDAVHGKRMTADTDRTNTQGENRSLGRFAEVDESGDGETMQ